MPNLGAAVRVLGASLRTRVLVEQCSLGGRPARRSGGASSVHVSSKTSSGVNPSWMNRANATPADLQKRTAGIVDRVILPDNEVLTGEVLEVSSRGNTTWLTVRDD